MGMAVSREIRRTPVGWWPPQDPDGTPQPQHDRSLADEQARRDADPGSYTSAIREPYYRPAWTDAERNGYQLYETVTEGTPLTPSFETPAQLINWLVTIGDGRVVLTRPQAEAIVREGWVPTGIVLGGVLSGPYEAAERLTQQPDQVPAPDPPG